MAVRGTFKPLNPKGPSPAPKDAVRMVTQAGEALATVIDLPGAGSVRVRIHTGPGQGQFKVFPIRTFKADPKGNWVVDDSRPSAAKPK